MLDWRAYKKSPRGAYFDDNKKFGQNHLRRGFTFEKRTLLFFFFEGMEPSDAPPSDTSTWFQRLIRLSRPRSFKMRLDQICLYLDPLFLLFNSVLTIILQLLLRGNLGQTIERMWKREEVREVAMVTVVTQNRRRAACFLLDPSKAILLGQKRPALGWMMRGGPRWWTVPLLPHTLWSRSKLWWCRRCL